MIKDQQNLTALNKAHQLVLKIYKLTKNFPNEEKYRLVDQLCRSASSVPANIAEGHSRRSKKEFTQYLFQAKSSLAETQYHLLLSKDLGYLSNSTYLELIEESNEVGRIISGLIRYLKSNP